MSDLAEIQKQEFRHRNSDIAANFNHAVVHKIGRVDR